jgi:hypothetical protein
VRAFAELPRELSAEMDEQQVALHTRIRFAQLRQGREEAAAQIWAAVKDRNRTDLLPAAIQASLDYQDLEPDRAVDAADTIHQQANTARSQKLSRQPEATSIQVRTGVVRLALKALRDLAAELRTGSRPAPFDEGSIRLLTQEITTLLQAAEPS